MRKVALVTGSSRGIGAATATELSRAGWAVCINYLERRDKAEALAAKLRLEGGDVMIRQADVADRKAVEAMAADIETSLRNFRTGYIDLYQVHNPNDAALDQVIGEGGALEALLEAKEAGKIGHIGLTAHSKAVAMRALDLPWVETVMFPFNIVEDQGRDVIEKAKEKNAGFIAMKPLAGGAIESGRTALRFLAKERGVDLIIPGMAELGELRENIAAVSEALVLATKAGVDPIACAFTNTSLHNAEEDYADALAASCQGWREGEGDPMPFATFLLWNVRDAYEIYEDVAAALEEQRELQGR